MRFIHRKRRQPPAIIIISLIDILIVLLIFLMVTTSFKQTPAVRLTLPESKQPKEGASPNPTVVIVTVAKTAPYLYLETRPVTAEKLQEELSRRVAKNPQLSLAIRADAEAPWKQVVSVMDVGKAIKVKSMTAFTKSGVQP